MSETAPSTKVSVRLIGGPDDWREQTLDHLSEADLRAPRESLGTYLISDCVPHGHPDMGARAVYEPNAEPAPADVWFFRGWAPVGPTDPEHRTANHHQAVDVDLDRHGLPMEWTTDEGVHHRVERVLVHWEASGENQLAPDGWHVRVVAGGDWELFAHPGHWEAGPLPAIQEQEHEPRG